MCVVIAHRLPATIIEILLKLFWIHILFFCYYWYTWHRVVIAQWLSPTINDIDLASLQKHFWYNGFCTSSFINCGVYNYFEEYVIIIDYVVLKIEFYCSED